MGRTYEVKDDKLLCPTKLEDFFHCIYQQIASASTIAPSITWGTLRSIVLTRSISNEECNLLLEYSPPLGNVALYLLEHKMNETLFNTGCDLLRHCAETALKNFRPQNARYIDCIKVLKDGEIEKPSARQELMQTGYYFPNRPIIRKLTPMPLKSEAVCNKDYKLPGKFGAGTLLFWCAQHRQCIGFIVLTEAESVRQVYELFVSRFKQMPKAIIYDNGCNLHEFALNRDPRLFIDTMFLSDGVHIDNHKNCSMSYNPLIYRFLEGKES
jgi:hypothetical protein